MTEAEAKSRAKKETQYCYVLAQAWEGIIGESICLERIFSKGGCEEIRLAWWKNNNQAMRPADIDAINWVALFTEAIHEGVFTAEEQLGMLRALINN
jgi:hypothetical protein